MSLWISLHLLSEWIAFEIINIMCEIFIFSVHIYFEILLLHMEGLINAYTDKFLELTVNETKLPLKNGSTL